MPKINEYTHADFVQALGDVLHISKNYKETFSECIALYLFLRKKGLADEYEADKEVRDEVQGMIGEAEQAYDKLMEERARAEEEAPE